MRKLAVLALSAALVMGTMTGCGSTNSDAKNSDNAGTNKSASSETGFDTSKDISVVSREDGSGTRGAFIELTGVEEKDADGNSFAIITLDYLNEDTYGKLKIYKSGEMLSKYENGQFVYEERPLKGATFEIYADGNIETQDNQGTNWYDDGELVATIKSGEKAVFTRHV